MTSLEAYGLMILGGIAVLYLLPFMFASINASFNPSKENVDKVQIEGVKAIENSAVPWWVDLFKFGIVGVIAFVVIFYFAPKLLSA